MTEFAFRPGDATWHKWRNRALTDLYFMAGTVCGYGDPVGMTPGMHGLFCKVVEKKTGIPELDTAPKRLILMPRGTGKSTLVAQAYVLQRICQDPNIAILIANEKLENAQTFLTAIKWQFTQNELFRALFPELIHSDFNAAKWNESEINVPRTTGRKEPTVRCQGVGAALASQHPDLVVVDDMLSREATENARRGDGQIVKAINRWNTQLQPLLNHGYKPFPEIMWLGTRWFRGDSYEFVEEAFGYGQERETFHLGFQLPNGDVQSLPVHRKGDLVLFTRQVIEDGRATWPERPGYDIESLAKMRLSDPELFAANMMNSPSDEVTATFKESWLTYYDWAGETQVRFVDPEGKTLSPGLNDLERMIFVDPGGFKRANKGDRSRGAILVTGSTLSETPSHLILEAWSERAQYLTVAKKVVDLCQKYAPQKLWIEVVGQQVVFYDLVKKMLVEAGLNVAVGELTPENVEKDARILELESIFQHGLVRVGRTAAMTEWREQYRSWPAPRADLLDLTAYAAKKWRKAKPKNQTQTARQQQERAAYLARRGMVVAR